MKKFGFKSVALIFIIILGLFLTNNGGLIQIEKTAIVSAIGVDEENGELVITAQVILPQASDTSENAKAVVSGTGVTIGSAIDNIGSDTGWYPKLSFCKIIIVNQAILDERISEVINYLLYSTKIYDSVLLCASKQSAKDVLTATSPLDILSAYSLEKIFLKNPGKASNVFYTRAKDLAENMTSLSKTGMIPLIDIDNNDNIGKVEPTEKPPEESLKDIIFKSYETLLFNEGKISGQLNKTQTQTYNFLYKDVQESYYAVSYENTDALLRINDSKRKVKITCDNQNIYLSLNLELKATLVEIKENGKIILLPTPKILPKELTDNASLQLKNSIISLFDKMKDAKSDIFFIRESLYEKHPVKYKNLSQNYLERIKFSVNASVSSPDKN
ncbi:MAG TPA: hypothetical protein DDW16_03410 [Clostridiales bacterium]|nr:hypothetical protein [Clostridiales bacterium]